MAAMSAEIARKYFGTLTEEAVRDGVEACVTLLSIGLLRTSSGAIEPEAWLQTMRAAGVRGISKAAVDLIKECDALPDMAAVNATDEITPPSLLMFLLAHASKSGAARAYAYLMRERSQRIENKRMVELADWLLANTPSGRIARRDMEAAFGFSSPDAEVVIDFILSLVVGISKKDPYADVLEEGPPESGVVHLGPRLLAGARSRYDAVLKHIPPQLKPALILHEETWFNRFVLPSRGKAESEKRKSESGEGKSGKGKSTDS